MAKITRDINIAKAALEKGKVVAIPTETVYGLAANGLNPETVKQIFALKERPLTNPLILHVASLDQAKPLVTSIPEAAQQLANAFWPGSLTLLLPKSNLVPDIITAGHDTVAIRIPNHPVTLQLLAALPFPLAAPSANPYTRISPTSAQHVKEYFDEKIEVILDGGACTTGVESTIIGFEGEKGVLYRYGGVAKEDIERIVGLVETRVGQSEKTVAPGMTKKHYSPTKPLLVAENVAVALTTHSGQRVGLITFQNRINVPKGKNIVLSPSGNLQEAASQLYSVMKMLDADDTIDLIIAEQHPKHGLGLTINDRLHRAAYSD